MVENWLRNWTHGVLSSRHLVNEHLSSMETVLRECAVQDKNWIRRRRKFDTFTIFKLLVSRLSCGRGLCSLTRSIAGASDSGMSKALRRVPANTFQRIFKKLLATGLKQYKEGPGTCGVRQKPRVLALDGSVVHVPDGFRAQGFNAYHRNRTSRPIGLLSALVDVETRQLVNYEWGKVRNERAHALCLFRQLGRGDTVIMDRGYFSRPLLQEANRLQIKVLFRVKHKACREVMECIDRIERTRSRFAKIAHVGNVRVRIFSFRARGSSFHCLTNDNKRSTRDMQDLYAKRWSVESFFRSLKTGMHLREWVSIQTTSPVVFKHILDCALLHYAVSLSGQDTPELGSRNGHQKKQTKRRWCPELYAYSLAKLFHIQEPKRRRRYNPEEGRNNEILLSPSLLLYLQDALLLGRI